MPPDYTILPEHLRAGMQRYVEHHIETGSGLRAVLENDLEQAVARLDAYTLTHISAIVRFVQSLPAECHGSKEAVAAWIRKASHA